MRRATTTVLAVCFLLAVVFVLRREDADGPLVRTRLLMGTVVEIRVHDAAGERIDAAVTAAFAEMAEIERLMSPHRPDSEISRLSAAPTALAVSAETASVMRTALAVTHASGGAFDPALGRLVRLWGFADGNPAVPDAEQIRQALAGTGPGALSLTDTTVVKRSPDLAVDLGGVAKGYAIDRAIAALAAAGIRQASVNAGGDLRLLGDREGRPWRIGIQHPRKAGAILATLRLADRAVVTSGDYERTFEQDGVRYHHILDPQTGYPARDCQAVTVVADEATLADAVATAAFVLGPADGMALLREFPGVEGLIVAADGSVDVTPGLQEVIEWP